MLKMKMKNPLLYQDIILPCDFGHTRDGISEILKFTVEPVPEPYF